MRVLMIAANTEHINFPTLPLGAALVAAATRAAGHRVEFLDLMDEADPSTAVRRTVEASQPDVIGISVRNIDDQDMATPVFLLEKVRSVVAACRQASTAPVVLGGAGYSIFPAAVLTELGADLGICGEGEEAFPRLLDCIAAGGDPTALAGVHAPGRQPAVPRSMVADLDHLPPPGPELWEGADLERSDLWVPVQTRRGCPYSCSYCSTPQIEGHLLRTRSPDLVTRQLASMAAAGIRRVQFVDNIFNVPSRYTLDLCRRIAGLDADLAWQCILYPKDVGAELAEAMVAAGCVSVSLGFESGCDRMLRALGKRFSSADVRRTSAVLAEHGIRRWGFLLLGGPGETRESVLESLDFIQSLDLDMFTATIGIRVYPNTPLAETAVAEGMLARSDTLLRPTFYLTPGLEEGWIREEVKRRLGVEVL